MKTNAAGIALIKEFEGKRLTAYPDPATGGKPWTIGYGATLGVKPGMTITEAEAEAFLRRDLVRFEAAVSDSVRVKLTGNQFSACVSLAFNVGSSAFSKSTLVKRINAGDIDGAAEQFARWNRAAGRVMPGLTQRRAAEAKLFRTADGAPVAITPPVPTTAAPLAKPSAPGFLSALLSLFRRKAV